MSYQSAYGISQDAQFQQRMAVALAEIAANVTSEAIDTANHANRVVLAKLIANNIEDYARRFSIVVMGNSTLQAKADASEISDNEIDFALSERFNVVAGVV